MARARRKRRRTQLGRLPRSGWPLRWNPKEQTFVPIFLVTGAVAIQFYSYVARGTWVLFINTTARALTVSFANSPFKPGGAPESFQVSRFGIVFRRVTSLAARTNYKFTVRPSLISGTVPPDGPAVIVG
ncbi:MAG: hypothetical protein ACHQ52_12515 [Candidatus Eisenbacteria bacterium]